MGCEEMNNALLTTLLPRIRDGIGSVVGAALNRHPDIKGTDIVPTTGKTLYDTVASLYPDKPDGPMSKAELLEGIKNHDKGMQIKVPSYAQADFDKMIEPSLHTFSCETASGIPTIAPSTPAVAVAGAKAASAYRG